MILTVTRIAVGSRYPRQPQSERHRSIAFDGAQRADRQQIQSHFLQGLPLEPAEQDSAGMRLQADEARLLRRRRQSASR